MNYFFCFFFFCCCCEALKDTKNTDGFSIFLCFSFLHSIFISSTLSTHTYPAHHKHTEIYSYDDKFKKKRNRKKIKKYIKKCYPENCMHVHKNTHGKKSLPPKKIKTMKIYKKNQNIYIRSRR